MSGNGLGSATASGGGAADCCTKADFSSDQETRWCPGCGDYAILASVQALHARARHPAGEDRLRHRASAAPGASSTTWTPTGCTASTAARRRWPPASRPRAPDLSVWVVSGDGDALSIGGNHLIHALRRNVPLKILLFNNQIYGLTKGQYSPTSEEGKVTKSTPFGSQDHPFNPVSLALGAEATLRRAHGRHRQEARRARRCARPPRTRARRFVEIYQNCNVFNDGAFDAVRAKGQKEHEPDPARARRADPLRRRGRARRRARRRRPPRARRRGRGRARTRSLVHDAQRAEPSLAFELAHLAARPTGPTPIGVFRDVERPVYGARASALELEQAALRGRHASSSSELLHSGDTWTVS